MAYIDPDTVHVPTTGVIAPAIWSLVVRDDLEFLVEPPAASIFNPNTQSVVSASDFVLDGPSENFDNASMHDELSNTSRLTFTTAGRYLLLATVVYSAGGVTPDTSNRAVTDFLVNGTTVVLGDTRGFVQGAVTVVSITRFVTVVAGDFAQVQVNQNTGTTIDVRLEEFAAMFRVR